MPKQKKSTHGLAYEVLGSIQLAGAEISAFDAASKRVFSTSEVGLQIVDLSNPAAPLLLTTIDLSGGAFGFSNDITSVAVHDGLVAVSVAALNRTDPGKVFLLDVAGNLLASFTVGSLPDMLVFTPDGKRLLVANEGEATTSDALAAGASNVNPVGSITVIDLSKGIAAATVQTAGFESFNGDAAALIADGVRLFVNSPGFEGITVAQDLEPEYIAIAPDGRSAMVTLQEANAVALLDLRGDAPVVTAIVPLGLKRWDGLAIDTSDRDGINFQTDQPVFGLYQPDGIASYRVHGQTYYVMANEGDDRDDFASETARLGTLDLDNAAFPNEAALRANGELGRLTVPALAAVNGDTDGDGDIDQILTYGGRSFSILDAAGNRVFDSGSQIDQFVAANFPQLYADGRSDNKGSEPEGVTIGKFEGRTYAFITLERYNSTIVYDITNPTAPTLATFLVNAGDVGPESGIFVAAKDSPSKEPLFIVSNEVSETLTVYELHRSKNESGDDRDDVYGTILADLMKGEERADFLYSDAGDQRLSAGADRDRDGDSHADRLSDFDRGGSLVLLDVADAVTVDYLLN